MERVALVAYHLLDFQSGQEVEREERVGDERLGLSEADELLVHPLEYGYTDVLIWKLFCWATISPIFDRKKLRLGD